MSRKYLFLVPDGMGDWPLEELGGKTVVEAADTPEMDRLAAEGLSGLCRTVPPAMPPGSDVANMSLLGFDPARYHTGRGPIEAAAQGLSLDPDDLVWRLNLVTVSQYDKSGNMLDYSSGHIATEVSSKLIEMLQAELGDETFSFHTGIQYRHLLVQKNGANSPEAGLEINPPHDITDKPLLADLETYGTSPALSRLMDRAAELLAVAPDPGKANSIWPWGQGRPLILPDFKETYGLKGAVVSAVDLVNGLGRAAGMEVIEVPGVTGLLDTNYEGKAEAALKFLEQGDFVYLHVEAPDECGHGGDIACKLESLRRFDSRIVAPLRKALAGTDAVFFIACDHFTPIVERTHTMDPVPFLLAWPGCAAPSGQSAYSEAQAASTGILVDPGHTILSWVLDKVS